jgi:Fe2+ transport system protein FeoA
MPDKTDKTKPEKKQKKTFPAISLDKAPSGADIEVVKVEGGTDTTRQLAQLGIRTKETGRVRGTAPLSGPVLLEINGSAVAIGRTLARKIMVRIVGQ